MRIAIAAAVILVIGGCAAAPTTKPAMIPGEREAKLLMEVDRARKIEKTSIDRLIAQRKHGSADFLARQESEARLRGIQLYESLLRRFPENRNDFMAEASFRLAELLFETERVRIQKFLDRKGDAADPSPDFHRTIDAYQALIDRFPHHPLVEDALYGLAYCYTEQGDPDRAAEGYSRLIELYPDTRYALEIRMRLGEYYFDRENLEAAIVHYRIVAKSDNAAFKDKAIYKLGWCYYNLDRYKDAIDTFFSLLDLDANREASPGSLVDESMNITARAYAERGGTPALVRRLSSRPSDARSPAILFRLADLYKERSLYPEAIGTYRTYIKRYPRGKDLPAALAHLIESYHIRGDTTAALNLAESYPEVLGPGSPWYTGALEAARGKAMAAIFENLKTSAERRRARFQAGGTEKELEKALADLGKYAQITSGQEPCGIQYLKGLTLADMNAYPEAALTLDALAERKTCADRAEAAGIRSLDFQIDTYNQTRKVDLDILGKTVGILEKSSPQNPATRKAILTLAQINLNSAHYQEARRHLSYLIRKYPSSPESAGARMLMARTFFKENDFKQASAWFREAWRKAKDPKKRAEAKKLHIYSRFKDAEELSRQKKPGDAAERFDSIYRRFPDSDVAQMSLYNAGQIYRNMGLEMKATSLFEELAAAYEKSDLASEALTTSVHILRALGAPVRAAEDSLALANRSTGDDRISALIQSADLFAEGKEFARASTLRGLAVKEAPEPLERRSSQILLAGENLESAGMWNRALEKYTDVISIRTRNPGNPVAGRLAYNAAKARLHIAEESYSRYQKVRIEPPLDRTTVAKRTLLQEVIGNFVAAGKYNIAEVSTASNYYIGLALEGFKDSILNSPRPDGLTAKELEEYELLLQEKAYPIEEKALKAYRVNVDRAVALQIFDPWIEKSYQRLAELAPWAFERAEKISYPLTIVPPLPITAPVIPGIKSISAALMNVDDQPEAMP